MTFKKCKNEGCEIQIEVRNTAEGWRPFEESGNKHNCQYSDYAKKQRAKEAAGPIPTTEYLEKLEQKNDHGNEQVSGFIPTVLDMNQPPKKGFVDHTQPPKLKLKVLTSTEAEGLSLLYNTFGESHNIRFSQYEVAGSLYTIAVFFEETAK